MLLKILVMGGPLLHCFWITLAWRGGWVLDMWWALDTYSTLFEFTDLELMISSDSLLLLSSPTSTVSGMTSTRNPVLLEWVATFLFLLLGAKCVFLIIVKPYRQFKREDGWKSDTLQVQHEKPYYATWIQLPETEFAADSSLVPRPFLPPASISSLPVFHTGSDEILAVGTAWERG